MKSKFLKNIPILILYIGFFLHLLLGFFSFDLLDSDSLNKISPLFLVCAILQTFLWNRKNLDLNKIITIISFIIINFYFLFDYYLLGIFIVYFNMELIGFFLNLLAVVSGIIISIQLLIIVLMYIINTIKNINSNDKIY